jgi:hypothetical protein
MSILVGCSFLWSFGSIYGTTNCGYSKRQHYEISLPLFLQWQAGWQTSGTALDLRPITTPFDLEARAVHSAPVTG